MKKKIVIIVLVILLVFSITLLGLNNNKFNTNKNEINVELGSEPNSLDPAISLTIDVRSYLANLFEGLLVLDQDGSLKPGVAMDWKVNEENTEYIFYLRNDAKWSDGTEVTANDFKYEWLRVLNPETASGWASYLYYIKGAEAYNNGTGKPEEVGIYVDDDYTLRIEMENPCSFFASMTAIQPYYPAKESIIKEYGDSWTQNSDSYVTNGAYKLESWEHDLKISIVKNENYWNNNEVKLSKINFMLYSDSSAILNAFEANELDYVEDMLTSEEMEQVSEIKLADFVNTKFLAFNLNSEVLKNIKVREALSIALDREEIAKMMGTQMEPLTGFIPYGFYNSDEQCDYTNDSNSSKYLSATANIEKAKQLLEEAGYKDGVGLDTITYLTNTSSSNMALAEVVKSQLAKIGANVEIQALESNVFNTYRKEKKFDIVAASWAAEYPDITSYLYGFKSTDLNNYSSFNDSNFDNLYNKIVSASNNEEKLKFTHQAENLVMNSYCVAPLYSEKACYIANDSIKGVYHDVTGCINFSRSYIE